MVINAPEPEHVKFVSYTGKYPCLCSGVLTLLINGKTCVFGHNFALCTVKHGKVTYKDEEICQHMDTFWEPKDHDEWIVDANKIPEQYRKYVDEIDRVFNENVPHGHCGGCE